VTLFASSLAFRFIAFLHVPAKVGVVAAILLQDSGIEGSVEDRRPQVRQLVEEPDGEVATMIEMLTIGKRRACLPSEKGSRLARIGKISDELRIRSKVTETRDSR
jgi:hypothetical protein